jgi:DNA primase
MLLQDEIVSILNKALNQKARIRKGTDAVYFCPNCKHYKRKLEINLITGKYNCWVCDFSGTSFKTLFKKLNLSYELYSSIKFDVKNKSSKSNNVDELENLFKENVNKPIDVLKLPNEYLPLCEYRDSVEYNNALKYLKSRNISKYDIYRYQIGYCEDGDYKQRIIIPSFDIDNNLNFFVGRSYYKDVGLKYNNCEFSKNIIGFESLIDFSQEITLVEGVFDAFAVRYNCIPLFGKTLSKKLKESLIINKVSLVNLLLDNDAIKESIRILEFLIKNNIKTRFVMLKDKDPSEIGFEKTWESINNSKIISFDELLKLKLLYECY